jgi:hypothetical protein
MGIHTLTALEDLSSAGCMLTTRDIKR